MSGKKQETSSRKARQEKRLERWIALFPPLERKDRLALVENLTEGSGWSMNFGVMLGCSAPLAYQPANQLRQGQAKPESLTLSESMWFRLRNRIDQEEGIDFQTGARASAERPEDVVLVITANRPVPGDLLAELDHMIDEGMGADVTVKMNVLQQGRVTPVEQEQPIDPDSNVND